ncbi:histidine kinase [Cutibacterium equinum]|uniref:histidine kinase n=1 Tax=Cutibacterium equinum TaxID=3016342 RepID=A0ABY7R062_9ACTN|nr:histidine kinase [Cutibacterium equinum]WCC80693.1 histidine kinase [Cutibacterium equinum]
MAAVAITFLVLSGIDDLRLFIQAGDHPGTLAVAVGVYVLSIIALLCSKWPQVQELLLLIALLGCVVVGKAPLGPPILGLLAFVAGQHGLKRHWTPIVLGVVVITLRSVFHSHTAQWTSALFVAIAAASIGAALGSAFRWLDGRREQAEEQAADALEQAAHAREEERQQLAAELHDVVAKDLTVITMLAGSLRLNTADESVIDASKSIETTSRTALDDLQRLLLVLRNQNLPLVSSPTHEDSVEATVAAMVTRLETLGWKVESSVECEPMPVSVSDAVNRILDESTANAIKHNGPATVKIIVRDDGDDVVVTVSNPVTDSDIEPVRSTGMGIARLKERVSLLRGEISIGLHNGWWVVDARIPRAKPVREN